MDDPATGAVDSAALPDEDAETLFERAPCGYLTTRLDGSIVRVNETFLGWTGYEREELIGRRRFVDLLTGGGRIYHETHYAPLLVMQGAVREIALDIVRQDGTRLPVLVNARVERDASGTPRLVRTTVFDATQRREYERELLRARERERAARERVERLQAVSGALVGALEPRQVGDAVLAALAPIASAGQAVLVLVDAPARAMQAIAWRGVQPDLDPVSLDDEAAAPIRRALEHGTARIDCGPPPPGLAGVPETAWGAGVAILPVAVDGRVVGAACLGLATEGPVDDAEAAFLVAVSEQCALALERTRLQSETVAESDRARLLARVGTALDEVQDVQGRTERLIASLVPTIADACWIEPATLGRGEDAAAPDAALRALASRALDERTAQSLFDRSAVALPLVVRGRLQGALLLVREPGRPPFDAAAVAFLADLAGRAALALENARVYEHERDIARTLQQSLLARAPLEDARLELATFYRAAVDGLDVGGDWHDAFAIAPGRVALVVGDIVGRGVHAAAATGRLRSAIRAFAVAGSAPGRLLEHLDAFVEGDEPARMATVVYVELDLERRRARLASAGHPPALLVEPGSSPRFVWDGRSAPLGAYPGPQARGDVDLELRAGSRLVLYTDGLVERRSAPLDVGFERLATEAARGSQAPLETMVDELVHALLADEQARDDVCVLALHLH